MSEVLYPEWRQDNEHSRYPFSDSASLTADTNQVLDKDYILDMRIYPIGITDPVYVSRITRTSAYVSINFASGGGEFGGGLWDIGTLTENKLELFDENAVSIGIIVLSNSGKIALEGWPIGDHNFAQVATELVSTCVVPQPQVGIRGFLLDDGSFLSGNAAFVGGRGVWLSDDGGHMRIDITGDFGQFKDQCGNLESFVTIPPVKTINGEPPDENGNFLIVPSMDNGKAPIFRVQLELPNTLLITSIAARS